MVLEIHITLRFSLANGKVGLNEMAHKLVPIHNCKKGTVRFQFINEQFLSGSRPHKGFRRGILPVCRSRKPAENADPGKKGHLWMETS